jgi:hypothetical protein
MQLIVGPADTGGNLWVIRPRARAAHLSDDVLVELDGRADLRVTRHPVVDRVVAAALVAEHCVSFFEGGGTFAARIARLTRQLAEVGVVPQWHWTDRVRETSRFIDDDDGAVSWFLSHSADILFVSSVAFEKQRSAVPSWMGRLRWASSVPGAPARA